MVDRHVSQLRDVDQALNALLDLGKGAKVDDVGDDALDQLAQFVLVLDQGPRFRLQPFQAQANTITLLVQAQDIHFHFLSHADDLFGMPDPPPAQLGDVNQAVGTAQVNKSAKGGQAADHTFAHLPLAQFIEESLPLPAAPLLLRRSRRKDQASLAPIDLDDLYLQFFTHQLGQALQPFFLANTHRKAGNLGGRDKTADLVHRHHHAALVVANDLDLPYLAALKELLGTLPGLSLAGHVQRDQQVSLFILGTQDIDFHLVAHRELFYGLRPHALQIGIGHNAISLGAHVDNDLLLSNGQDQAGADLASPGPLIVPILDGKLLHIGRHRLCLLHLDLGVFFHSLGRYFGSGLSTCHTFI